MNNDLFSTRAKPELKIWYYHALLGYVTILRYQVGIVHDSHNCFVKWRPRDTISAQTMARHQSRV